MRSEPVHPDPERSTPRLVARDDVVNQALVQGLDLPLTAMRASLETLRGHLERDAQVRDHFDRLLGEVDRMGRNVRDLVDYMATSEPLPLRGTLTEVVGEAVKGLTDEQRGRIITATDNRAGTIRVDVPLITRALRRLVENSLESGSSFVLVLASNDGTTARFSVVDDGRGELDANWARSAFRSTKRNRLGLGLTITERDVNLMAGSFQLRTTTCGGTAATLTLPTGAEPGVEAAA